MRETSDHVRKNKGLKPEDSNELIILGFMGLTGRRSELDTDESTANVSRHERRRTNQINMKLQRKERLGSGGELN